PGMYVRADAFEMQMRFLKEHFEVLPLDRLLGLWKTDGIDDRKRYCVVTFDDGWLDNYHHAYPVLRRLGIPATVFLPTGMVGTDEWFWPDKLAYILAQRRKDAVNRNGGSARLEHEIEAEIGRWKRMGRAEIDRALEAATRQWGGRLPRERVVINWDE